VRLLYDSPEERWRMTRTVHGENLTNVAIHTEIQHCNLKLHITGGSTKVIHLTGSIPDSSALTFKSKAVNGGYIPVGHPSKLSVDLVNRGAADVSMRVVKCPGVECQPMKAIVCAGDSLAMLLTISPLEAGVFRTVVEVEVRGGKTFKLPVTAEAVVPDVSIFEDEFNFGTVYQGGNRRLPLTLVNRSPVEARLVMDLTKYPMFRLAISKDEWDPSIYIQCPLQAQGIDMLDSLSSTMSRCACHHRSEPRSEAAKIPRQPSC
jgi:hypothetical protein